MDFIIMEDILSLFSEAEEEEEFRYVGKFMFVGRKMFYEL